MHTEGNEVHVSEEEASGGSKEGVVRWHAPLAALCKKQQCDCVLSKHTKTKRQRTANGIETERDVCENCSHQHNPIRNGIACVAARRSAARWSRLRVPVALMVAQVSRTVSVRRARPARRSASAWPMYACTIGWSRSNPGMPRGVLAPANS